MKKCIIIPDSFKGTMSALEFCQIAKDTIIRHEPDCQVLTIPVADGGEGTVECFMHAIDAEPVDVAVKGPWMEPITARYAVKGDTAFVEMAQAAGLPMVGSRKNPAKTSTYGVGMIIRNAVEKGYKNVVLGLGGSCTNDAGTGCACALGVKFFDANGKAFMPTGDTLEQIVSYDLTETKALLEGCTITAMCDIDNPMYGPQGAAAIFGPQKGADEAMVAELDRNLKHLGDLIEKLDGRDVAHMPGAGAAGAFGTGVVAFLGGGLKSGIDTVLDCVDFDTLLDGTDLVFTGEGQIDSQSLRGKAVIGIAGRAAKKAVPVIVVVGSVGDGAEAAYEMGVSSIFSINRRAEAFETSKYRTKENFAAVMDAIVRTLKLKG